MRKVTATTNVANYIIAVSGNGWMKFNDKLKDGTRSLKVLGWTREEYEWAQRMLDCAGYKTKLVWAERFSTRGGAWYTQIRLHVKEA